MKRFASLTLLVALGFGAIPAPAVASPECPWRNSQLIQQAESDNFIVFICSAEGKPNVAKYYHGLDRRKDGQIKLPLTSTKNGIYTAKNGRSTYILNLRNPANMTLTLVSPNGKRMSEAVWLVPSPSPYEN